MMSLPQVLEALVALAACWVGLHLVPLGVARIGVWLETVATPGTELHRTTGLGPDWRVRPAGAGPGATMRRRCTGLFGVRQAARAVAVSLAYTATATPGVSMANCPACRTAWVRVGGR